MMVLANVKPNSVDVWHVGSSVKIGYDVNFTCYFYKPQPMRSLEEIQADIVALEQKTKGLLGEIVGEAR